MNDLVIFLDISCSSDLLTVHKKLLKLKSEKYEY